jgi:hypothetical protein
LKSFVMAHSFMRFSATIPIRRLPLLRYERRTAASAIGGPFGVQAIGGGATVAGEWDRVRESTHVVFYRAGEIEKHSPPTGLRGQARKVDRFTIATLQFGASLETRADRGHEATRLDGNSTGRDADWAEPRVRDR